MYRLMNWRKRFYQMTVIIGLHVNVRGVTVPFFQSHIISLV